MAVIVLAWLSPSAVGLLIVLAVLLPIIQLNTWVK